MLDPILLDRQGALEDQVTESAEIGEEKPVTVSRVNAQPSSSSVKCKVFFILLIVIKKCSSSSSIFHMYMDLGGVVCLR